VHPATITEPGEPPARPLFAGRYRILSRLGRGAVKEVCLASDERLGREVALALAPEPTPGTRARFELEARIMAQLGDHPHLVTLYDAGEQGGIPYFVCRHMAGGSLAERLAREPERRLPMGEAKRVGRHLALALEHAHSHGVVHRDVKPDNVWLGADGSAALGDFGVALAAGAGRVTAEGALVGTLRYLSPEQARGAEVDGRADLYALGATLYELLSGRPPFVGLDPASLIAQHLTAAPTPPSAHAIGVPDALDSLVLALLSKQPADRPASAAMVAELLGGDATTTFGAPPGESAFVDRRRELAALHTALADAMVGRGRIVVLAGEPGIGKTRLVEELAVEARRRGATMLRGRSAEDRGAPAYWPWAQVLRRLVGSRPELDVPGELALIDSRLTAKAPPGGAETERFLLFDATAELLRAAAKHAPLVVALDDMQWADDSSLALLGHLAQEIRSDARVLVVVTARAAGIDRAGSLWAALERLARQPGSERIDLGGLPVEDLARMRLTGGEPLAPALAAALRERTGGNPFFVQELLRMLVAEDRLDADRLPEAVPESVRPVVARRIEQLPERAREALCAASVVGEELDLRLLAAVLGTPVLDVTDALEQPLAAGLLAPAEGRRGRLRFAHALVREVVYEELGLGRRTRLHAALAQALEARVQAGADIDPSELAHHHLAAARGGQDPGPALVWARRAAEVARGGLAYAEEVRHREHALEAVRLGAAVTRTGDCDLMLDLGEALIRAGDLEAGRREHLRAAERARDLTSPEPFVRAVLGYAYWGEYGVVDHRAIALLDEALARLPPGDLPLRARALAYLALRRDAHREQPRREELLDEAIAMARRLSDQGLLADLLGLSALLNWRPERVDVRRAATEESIALAEAGVSPEGALWSRIVRFVDLFGEGRIREADAELASYRRQAGELRSLYHRWYGLVLGATRETFCGRVAEGARLANEAVHLIRRFEPDSEQDYTVQRLMLAKARGEPGEADRDTLHELAARYPRMPLWQAMAANLDWELGRAGDARQTYEACARDDFRALAPDADRLATLALLAEVAAGLGDVGRAAQLLSWLETEGGRNVVVERGWAALGAAHRQLGRLAAVRGEHRRAARHFAAARELNAAWNAETWVAHVLHDWAMALPDDPRRGEIAAEGLAYARRLELPGLIRRLEGVAATSAA